MKVLIVGGGGREHALAWKISQSKLVTKTYVAPGNGGTELEENISNIDIKANDIEKLAHFALTNKIDLTIVGPEDPLVNGISNKFKSLNLNCFGPSKEAAQLEGSKEYMKNFLTRYSIPTAKYETFTDSKQAISYVKNEGCPIVIKADGLAAGKGVTVAFKTEEAIEAIKQSLDNKVFGEAGAKVIIEEFLEGEEASFIVLTDGDTILPFASSQDHKARDDKDLGPNTGGMGAYSPAPIVTPDIHSKIMSQVIRPTIDGLKLDGHDYCGFLYAGIIVDSEQNIKVLEFNCRLGDPETQPIMMRLNSELALLCYQATQQTLKTQDLQWKKEVSLGVVMASGGYPNTYKTGHKITGIPNERDHLKVFHAGTELTNQELRTSGGRVLCVVALGQNTLKAQTEAYNCVKQIKWENNFFRKDIGYRAIEREKK